MAFTSKNTTFVPFACLLTLLIHEIAARSRKADKIRAQKRARPLYTGR